MKRRSYIQLIHILLFILLSGVMWRCVDEHVIDTPINEDKENTITFSIKIPSSGIHNTSNPTTRALSEGDENEVNQVAVLLFDSEGNYTHQPFYSSNISTNLDNSQIKTFTIKVPEGTYDMVVLANSNESLAAVLGSIIVGQPKTELLNKLLLSNSGKWNATPGSSNYIPIPMWGEAASVTVNGTPVNVSVTLVRMVAKIDVALTTSTAKSKFNLESVRLYNYNDKAQIVPFESNWSSGTSVVTAPSIPATANKPTNPATQPLLYDGLSITEESGRGISCINEIYTFEALKGTSSTLSTNTCLVVGGKYGSDSQITYYRIDFANTSDTSITYFPLLRNHNYKANITDIKDSGLPTPEDAFNARPANIEVSVINWNETEITDIVFDGQYMLGVSQSEFTFTRKERNASDIDNTLSVTTDYPGGWEVEKIVDADNNDINSATISTGWLSVIPNSGVMGAITDTKLIAAENDTENNRSGYIHLSAGRLTYIVEVEQLTTTLGALDILISDIESNPINTLEFTAAKDVQPDMQQFKLNWSPASSSLSYIYFPIGNPFVFATGAGLDVFDANGTVASSGTKTFSIQPTSITSEELSDNPFYERSSTFFCSTDLNSASTANKTLKLRQYVPTMIPVLDEVYLLDGEQKSFGVRTNVPFTATLKENPDGIISSTLTTTGEVNTSESGTAVSFTLINDLDNPNPYQKNAVVTIKSNPEGLFPTKDITLVCRSADILGKVVQEANSYIVAPNSEKIYIPVSRVNSEVLKSDLGLSVDRLGADEVFNAHLVWTDNSIGLGANSNIISISTSGIGTGGYLVVEPGSAEGNAVVAIRNSADKILWSWHIWVTNYSPTPSSMGGFMDRNLGAMSSEPENYIKTFGLRYQWGRKDPFPGSVGIYSVTVPKLYDKDGSEVTINKTSFLGSGNLTNAVANPRNYYGNSQISIKDWYSTVSGEQNDNLWNPAIKTIYDPCPPGWRVPEISDWDGLNDSNFPWISEAWPNVFHGRTNDNFGGFYPAAGFGPSNIANDIVQQNTSGGAWSSEANGELANALRFTTGSLGFGNTLIDPSLDLIYQPNDRAMSLPVRCVRE